jgi:hypothetical protein
MQGSILKLLVYAPEGVLWAFEGAADPCHSVGRHHAVCAVQD